MDGMALAEQEQHLPLGGSCSTCGCEVQSLWGTGLGRAPEAALQHPGTAKTRVSLEQPHEQPHAPPAASRMGGKKGGTALTPTTKRSFPRPGSGGHEACPSAGLWLLLLGQGLPLPWCDGHSAFATAAESLYSQHRASDNTDTKSNARLPGQHGNRAQGAVVAQTPGRASSNAGGIAAGRGQRGDHAQRRRAGFVLPRAHTLRLLVFV